MNPALLQNNYSNPFSLTNEIKYSSHDRPYPNAAVVTNEYFDRRNGLPSSAINQSIANRVSSNGLEYDGSHSLQNQPYSSTSSQYLVTPPQSLVDSASVNQLSTSAFSYSTLPKSTASNASSLPWTTDTTPWQPNYHNMMPDMRQMPPPQLSHLSPPNMHPQFPPARTPLEPPVQPQYFLANAYNGPSYMNQNRNMPVPFKTASSSYPPINPQPLMRPEGPPFDETQVVRPLVNSRNIGLTPDIMAGLTKGFFQVDGKWTCYRRNYFQVSCAFSFKPATLDNQIFLQRSNGGGHGEQVIQWALSISAKTSATANSESESRALVQHTAKRDKATEGVPSRHVVVPSLPSNISINPGSNHSYYPTVPHLNPCLPGSLDNFGPPSSSPVPSHYLFERIQFQKATANNGKRRAQQQYFHLVVCLEANIGRYPNAPEWVVVAERQSAPMVVRGRSPGHYKDNPPNLHMSSDSEDSQGHPGPSGHAGFSLPQIGNNQATSMSWSPGTVRDGSHYGPSSYSHRLDAGDYCPMSPGSSPSSMSASSPDKNEGYGMSHGSGRPVRSESNFDRIVLSPISHRLNNDHMDYLQSGKRSYESDGPNGGRPFFPNTLDPTYQSPSFDFSAIATPQGLCASS